MRIRKLYRYPEDLTERARRVWAVISCDRLFSLRELCEICDLSSASVAAYELKKLARLGIIERDPHLFRAYRVKQPYSWCEL